MSVIKLLPDHIANQIAAGEVIQRPASVVKELVENAIDAGATKIDIIIKDAGRTLIQIVDNGSGMSDMDAVMCFERHATSKLSDAKDLFQLQTKGFRGEALASIAAIAHVTLTTCQETEEVGTCVEVEGSQVTKNEATVCAKGTSFAVKNLFFNVPARRNFLKSEGIEFKHIVQEFERVALPHSEIHFTLTHNGETLFNLPGANLRKRIVDLHSKSFNDKLVPIQEVTEIVELQGFVIKPEAAKKSRGDQYFFVNNRYFKDPYFHNAVSKAFDNLLQTNMFPGYFLFLTVDPEKIDVNVHPTKTEIKFEEDRLIYSIILTAVKNSLGKFNIMPTLDFEAEVSFDVPAEVRRGLPQEPQIQYNPNYNPFQSTTSSSNPRSITSDRSPAIQKAGFGQINATEDDWKSFYTIEEEKEEEQVSLDLELEESKSSNLLISGNYLISNTKGGVLTIQYRRAQERILYDDLMSSFVSQPIASQGLLFPYDITIDHSTQLIWQENEKMLRQLGFQWVLEKDNLALHSVPCVLHEENLPSFVQEMAEQLNYAEIDRGELAHKIILSLARSASQLKNLIANNEMAHELVERLFLCSDHIHSPTGKTILKKITFDQIEKL